MRASTLASTLAIVGTFANLAIAQVTGQQGDALEVTTNPGNAQYLATVPGTGTGGNKGVFLQATAETATGGVRFTININGVSPGAGPFRKYRFRFSLAPLRHRATH